MDDHREGDHCRICGSYKINRFQFASEVTNKVNLHEILRRDGSLDKLIRPCECRGEFALAHKVCLSSWIETTKHQYCDICRFEYKINYLERSIFDWVFETNQIKSAIKVVGISLLIYYLSALGLLVTRGRLTKNVLDIAVTTSAWFWIIICSSALTFHAYKKATDYMSWKIINRRVDIEENKSPQLDSEAKPKDVLKSSGFNPK